MKKGILLIILGVLVIVGAVFLLRPKPSSATQSEPEKSAEDIVANVEKEIAKQSGSGDIVVPRDVQDCPSKWFQEVGGKVRVVCDESQKAPYCSYYTVEKNGTVSTKLLEFTSECAVCRNHKKKGEVFIDDSSSGKYTHLGYQKGVCTQGMYKGK